MTARRVRPKPREFSIVQRAVEDGLRSAYMAHLWKHRDEPLTGDEKDLDYFVEITSRDVMNELCEVWRFDE